MRGDIHRLKAARSPKGHEQACARYAVVVQSDALPLSTLLIAPTSTKSRPASFRPEIGVSGQRTRVLVEQTTAVDPSRLGERVGTLTTIELGELERALGVVLDL